MVAAWFDSGVIAGGGKSGQAVGEEVGGLVLADGGDQGVQVCIPAFQMFVLIVEECGPQVGGRPVVLPAGGEAGVEDGVLVRCHPGERVIFTEEYRPV